MPKVGGALLALELASLAKLAPADLKLLWVNDWYDGILEAVVEHAGAPCIMALHSEVEGGYRWLLVRLTPEEHAEETKWHALFAEHVGEHWCFHKGLDVHAAFVTSEPDKFYEPYRARTERELAASAVVGWTDAMPTQ